MVVFTIKKSDTIIKKIVGFLMLMQNKINSNEVFDSYL